ncbi:hypothetical protein BJY59DRAFT_695996 [Rhodotorula toruloides]
MLSLLVSLDPMSHSLTMLLAGPKASDLPHVLALPRRFDGSRPERSRATGGLPGWMRCSKEA